MRVFYIVAALLIGGTGYLVFHHNENQAIAVAKRVDIRVICEEVFNDVGDVHAYSATCTWPSALVTYCSLSSVQGPVGCDADPSNDGCPGQLVSQHRDSIPAPPFAPKDPYVSPVTSPGSSAPAPPAN
jgi:hypothetical protein